MRSVAWLIPLIFTVSSSLTAKWVGREALVLPFSLPAYFTMAEDVPTIDPLLNGFIPLPQRDETFVDRSKFLSPVDPTNDTKFVIETPFPLGSGIDQGVPGLEEISPLIKELIFRERFPRGI